MSHIGSAIIAGEIDWDRAEEHGSFVIFSHGQGNDEFHLRCVVWRDDQTRAIIVHNFDYTRAASRDWWTAHEADTPEACLTAVPPQLCEQAEAEVRAFRKDAYPALVAGTLPLTEVREEQGFELCHLKEVLGSLSRLARP